MHLNMENFAVVQSKTKDNVFCVLVVSIMYQVATCGGSGMWRTWEEVAAPVTAAGLAVMNPM